MNIRTKISKFFEEFGLFLFASFLGISIVVAIPVIVTNIHIGSPGNGTVTGRLVDVEWRGWFMESCEIGIQYGNDSSKIEFVSSRNKSKCDDLKNILGKNIVAKYIAERFVLSTDEREQIQEYKVID